MSRRIARLSLAAMAAVLFAAVISGFERSADLVIAQGPSGRTIQVGPKGDLQDALDMAHSGDVIVLQAGAVYRGPFVLPAREGDAFIEIRTSARESADGVSDEELPPAGVRVTPRHSAALAVLEAAGDAVIGVDVGAHHYRLVGLEIRPAPGEFTFSLVELGSGRERSVAALPHHIRIERSYLHGDPRRGSRRGIAMNGRNISVVDSYLSDFKEVGADSQAIAGWNGPGPFEIVNNYLEGAGENIMFGGSDPFIRDLVPSDIQIRHNHFSKPLAWKAGEAGYVGVRWAVKNLLELKNARRVVIDGNVLERNWPDAQNGFAVLFTVRNQDGAAPWSTVEDVLFSNNIVRDVSSAINILGRDNNYPSGLARNIRVVNNLFAAVGEPPFGSGKGDGRFLQLLEESGDIVVEHNTVLHSGNILTVEGRQHTGFVFRNNIVLHNEFGIIGTGKGSGRDAIGAYLPGAVFKSNAFVGGSSSNYPSDNFFPDSLNDLGFRDMKAGDYALVATSAFRSKGTDGRDVGADLEAIASATQGVLDGVGGDGQRTPPSPCDDLIRRRRIAESGCLGRR